jgi:hypothetical protein
MQVIVQRKFMTSGDGLLYAFVFPQFLHGALDIGVGESIIGIDIRLGICQFFRQWLQSRLVSYVAPTIAVHPPR